MQKLKKDAHKYVKELAKNQATKIERDLNKAIMAPKTFSHEIRRSSAK